LIASDPRIVLGLDYVGITGLQVRLGAVIVHDVHRPGLHDAHVPSLATVGADDQLDGLRASPARLGRKATDRRVVEPDLQSGDGARVMRAAPALASSTARMAARASWSSSLLGGAPAAVSSIPSRGRDTR
jgi:hypothetical protein